MRKVLLTVAVLAMSLALAANANAFTKQAVPMGNEGSPSGLSQDCVLQSYNICSCWIWVFTEVPGSLYGAVFDPTDCPGGCQLPSGGPGGAVSDIWLYSRCTASGDFGVVGVSTIDPTGCPVTELYNTGPFTTTHCVVNDRWTHIDVPLIHVNGEPFAITIEWGSGAAQLASDNGIANLICSFGITGTFPGCFNSTCTCSGWSLSPATSFVYTRDFTGDTIPDDICAIYGYPYALAFPYYPGIGYIPNNIVLQVGLDCTNPTATENTSWGHVKALYE
jgi:hypothetical protein